MSECRLVFGALELTDPLGPYVVHGEGADLGNPVPVVVAMERMLQDGAVASTLRNDNRTQRFFVTVKGADGIALAENERALVLETGKRNTLSWTPPDGYAPTTVFDVQTSWLDNSFDDLGELRGERVYGLTITALPFGRSVDPVLADAVFDGTSTVVDGMNAATGWTATAPGGAALTLSVDTTTFATATGSLTATKSYTPPNTSTLHVDEMQFHRAASFAMSGAEYLTLQVRTQYATQQVLLDYTKAGVRTINAELISSESMPAGFTRYKWRVGDGTVSDLTFRVRQYMESETPPASMQAWADDLARVTASGASTKQSLRLLPVTGSARTPGSLQISHATSALGQTLVFTCPDKGDGYRPDLRRWRTSGPAVTSDATTVSGSVETIESTTPTVTVLTAPARMLAEDAYWLMVRAKRTSGAGGLLADVRTKLNGVTLSTVALAASGMTTAYKNHLLGSAYLPGVALPPGSAATVEITLRTDGVANIQFDEAWLFRADGVLTEVDCGSAAPSAGGSSNRLWLDTASVERPTPAVWVGVAADRTDARYAGPVLSGGLSQHEFTPPTMEVFVVTSNAVGPTVTLQHHPRWHTNAAS